MSPTGPLYAGSASQSAGGVSWASLTNATGAPDGSYATCGPVGPGGGGGTPNQLLLTNYGFNLPSYAIIDGIQIDIYNGAVGASNSDAGLVNLLYSGGGTSSTYTPNPGQGWAGNLVTHGGPTSLWGRNWTVSDINNSAFGAAVATMPGTGTWGISVDSVQITVYWHVAPAIVPKRYIYKVFGAFGKYLGNLPNISDNTPFTFSQDINTAGTSITVECAVSIDTAALTPNEILDETGDPLLDETGDPLLEETAIVPITALGTDTNDALIKNGNTVHVWEYSYYHPNGKIMFAGQIQRWEASYGGSGAGSGGAASSDTSANSVTMTIYSDGQDLDNYIVRGAPYTYTSDVYQGSNNANDTVSTSSKGAAFTSYGQTWKVGTGVHNLGQLGIKLNGTADVTITVYDGIAMTNLIGTVTQSVSVGSTSVVNFQFPLVIPVTPGNTYFFTVTVGSGQTIQIYYQNTNVYADGSAYYENYSGGSYSPSYGAITGDLFFHTYSGTGSTTATYTSEDPTTGMLVPIIADYTARGGLVALPTPAATGLSLTYTFTTKTTFDALGVILSLCPDGWYYYVDLGADTLVFAQVNTEADIILTKGRHLSQVTIIATIESIYNQEYLSGGTVSGSNIYVDYADAPSQALYGPRLKIASDNGILDNTTANTVAQTDVDANKDEQYQTTITVLDKTCDITLFKPGLVIGFNGFGTFVDNMIAQIVRIDYAQEQVTLTLGILPKRQALSVEQISRALIAAQTVANPTTPS